MAIWACNGSVMSCAQKKFWQEILAAWRSERAMVYLLVLRTCIICFRMSAFMVVMKGYVRNCSHPEGFMIEGYTTKEVIKCYADYIKDGKPICVPVS
jgi:hypothetical protein